MKRSRIHVCITLKKVDSKKVNKMKLKTEFQKLYYPQVIDLYQQTGYSGYKIAKLKLLPVSKSVMCEWIATFEAENGKGSPQRIMKAQQSKEQEEIESLKEQIVHLEEQLRREKMRSRLNEKIIEIAEQKFNIEIRKKPGAKQ